MDVAVLNKGLVEWFCEVSRVSFLRLVHSCCLGLAVFFLCPGWTPCRKVGHFAVSVRQPCFVAFVDHHPCSSIRPSRQVEYMVDDVIPWRLHGGQHRLAGFVSVTVSFVRLFVVQH